MIAYRKSLILVSSIYFGSKYSKNIFFPFHTSQGTRSNAFSLNFRKTTKVILCRGAFPLLSTPFILPYCLNLTYTFHNFSDTPSNVFHFHDSKVQVILYNGRGKSENNNGTSDSCVPLEEYWLTTIEINVWPFH